MKKTTNKLKSDACIIKELLVKKVIIDADTEIILEPKHAAIYNNSHYTHFLITCRTSGQKFFLKLVQEGERSFHCDSFLNELANKYPNFNYPQIIVPVFDFKGLPYFITNYISGNDLDELSDTLNVDELFNISDEILKQLKMLSSVKSEKYTENQMFSENDYATIMINKLNKRMTHPVVKMFDDTKFHSAFNNFCNIMRKSHFSKPTLIHMDIKPANVIYDITTRKVTLIDYQLSRFGDIDDSLIQILLSTYNLCSDRYIKYIYPNLIKNNLNIEEALKVPKLQCYIFYQMLCKLTHFHDMNQKLPLGTRELFEKTLNILEKSD